MPPEVTNDRRVRRTRALLEAALVELILERGYDHLTVQDILDQADIGRSTFYNHYQSKDDLFLSRVHACRVGIAGRLDLGDHLGVRVIARVVGREVGGGRRQSGRASVAALEATRRMASPIASRVRAVFHAAIMTARRGRRVSRDGATPDRDRPPTEHRGPLRSLGGHGWVHMDPSHQREFRRCPIDHSGRKPPSPPASSWSPSARPPL